MLRSMKELQGYKLLATDGQIGKVHDFYFGDEVWTIRYLVADAGSWLKEQRVLISPVALAQPDWSSRLFPVNLTREQIEKSPDIDVDKPVSRQHEERLNKYYNWPLYWVGAEVAAAGATVSVPPPVEDPDRVDEVEKGKGKSDEDTHLRSMEEVLKYHIRATDGDLGHVDDFIADDEKWIIRYLVIDTRKWLPGGKKIFIAPAWIERIDWAGAQVHVGLTKELIENSPEYDQSMPVNREYEERLYDFYGRPKYWR